MAGEARIRRSVGFSARRATHQLTKIYSEALKPTGLTVGQFGLLAYLYGGTRDGVMWFSRRALAEFTGIHPSSLSRHLKLLRGRGWVTCISDASDRRRRFVSITAKGRARLQRAVPFWRRAQAQTRDELGDETMRALARVLDLTSAKLKR
jgi:DNA-binding MarR family transcriptional regulator